MLPSVNLFYIKTSAPTELFDKSVNHVRSYFENLYCSSSLVGEIKRDTHTQTKNSIEEIIIKTILKTKHESILKGDLLCFFDFYDL